MPEGDGLFQVRAETRFAFGENWRSFLTVVNERRIAEAENSLRTMFDVERMEGKKFLDIGSGSGMFSLAARRLGAYVHSFDYDPDSVKCAEELRRQHEVEQAMWRIEQGSVLDWDYLRTLGRFDYVYCWGVLHHTGHMWDALERILPLVRKGGKLFVAIYNDQGWLSTYWAEIKKRYNYTSFYRVLITLIHAPYLFLGRWTVRMLTRRLALERGMSLWHDMQDWLGGVPFQVARPQAAIAFVRERGFSLVKLHTCGRRHGCNEFVFVRG